jgi:hypothetical protein
VITLLLVLIVLCLIIPFRLVGFLMILGVIHHCTTGDAEDGPAGHPSISQKDK